MVRATAVLAVVTLAWAAVWAASPPIIIGHRGASGYRPEHTLAAYRLAVEMGADYIEPDLVSTKDGVLIARHENEIGGTTDVAMRFPDRRQTKTVDGQAVTGWFTEDFTLAEIKTLRGNERLPFRSHEYDGQFEVPTFDEVLDLALELGRSSGRPVGVYPETKHPSYFRQLGLPIEEALIHSLEARGLNRRDAPVFIQSFETSNLRMLRERTSVRLIQLIDERVGPWDRRDEATFRTVSDLISNTGLTTVASYADGIGVNTRLVVPAGAQGALMPATDLVTRAHAANLLVHVWTLRREPAFLSPDYKGNLTAEFRQFIQLGVDGIFTDFPDIGARAAAAVR